MCNTLVKLNTMCKFSGHTKAKAMRKYKPRLWGFPRGANGYYEKDQFKFSLIIFFYGFRDLENNITKMPVLTDIMLEH